MKTILEFIRQELQEKSYYLGALFWALGSLLGELGKMKKSAIDSGLASQDLNWVVTLYNLTALLFFGIALIFLVRIWQKLRLPFTTYHPTLWQYGLSWTWMSLRAMVIVILTMIPAGTYAALNYMLAITNPIRYGLIVGALTFVMMPFWFFLFYGANAMVIARGNSQRALRDGLKAMQHIWREALLTFLLSIVPAFILTPIRLLSFKFHALEVIAIGLNTCFAPYTFGVLAATYLYLGKRLLEKAPELVRRTDDSIIS